APFKSESPLLERGRHTYRQLDASALSELGELDLVPVQRNRGMDAILRRQYRDRPVAVRVQRAHATALEAARLLARAGESKGCQLMILILTGESEPRPEASAWPARVVAVDSTRRQIAELLGLPRSAGARPRADGADQINLR